MATKKTTKKAKTEKTASTCEAFYKSFYSKQFYYDVARKWEGCGFKVLTILSLALTLLITVLLAVGAYVGMSSQEFKSFVSEVPNITLKNGEISMDKPSPYFIPNDPKEERAIIIDTSPQMDAKSEGELIDWMKQNKYKVVVTKHRFLMEDEDKNEIKSVDLHENKELELNITNENIFKWSKILLYITVPIMALFMFGFVIIYFILEALIYATIGILIGKLFKSDLEFNALQRIAACAIIPALAASIVATHIIGASLPFLVLVIIDLAFVTFGIKSAQNSQK